jgi:hypothetical protein
MVASRDPMSYSACQIGIIDPIGAGARDRLAVGSRSAADRAAGGGLSRRAEVPR